MSEKKKKKKNNNYYALEKEKAKQREIAYYKEQKKERKSLNLIFAMGLLLSIIAMIFAIMDLVDGTDSYRLVYGLAGGLGFLLIGASFLQSRKAYALICAGIGLVLLFSTSSIIVPYLQGLVQ